MVRFDHYKLIRTSPENTWYNTYDSIEEAIEVIKKWEIIIDTEEYMVKLYQNDWTEVFTDYEKKNLKNRVSCLMRILILRAQNIVVTDFEDFPNRFYRPGRCLRTR